MKKVYFCPNCRRKIDLPQMLKNPNMKMGGNVVLNCGHCNPDGDGNPKGKITIKPKNTEKIIE